MSIQGSLETFDLSNLLQMIKYERKTGRLTIRYDDNQVQIYLQDGDIVFATEAGFEVRAIESSAGGVPQHVAAVLGSEP